MSSKMPPNVASPFRALLTGQCVVFALGLCAGPAPGQGCVSTRCPTHFSSADMGAHVFDPDLPMSKFQFSLGYRWFESDRHFVGDDEQTHRQEEGSEVINDSHFLEATLTYSFSPRLSTTLVVPYSIQDRSSTVRSNGPQPQILERYSVQASGLGDIRLGANLWVLDPATNPKGNLLVSLGIDVPTGEDDVSDWHRRLNSQTGQIESFRRTVDQSIQPGDGGWGIPIDLYGYFGVTDHTALYVSCSYLITPEEKNGVMTGRSNPFEAEMSIADTFAARAGVQHELFPELGITASLGARVEGVPVHDLMGGSEGFRRPGVAVSIEPGLSWSNDDWHAALTVPIAVYRNRFRSVPDRMSTAATGVYRHGDAAFADFLVQFTIGKRF